MSAFTTIIYFAWETFLVTNFAKFSYCQVIYTGFEAAGRKISFYFNIMCVQIQDQIITTNYDFFQSSLDAKYEKYISEEISSLNFIDQDTYYMVI